MGTVGYRCSKKPWSLVCVSARLPPLVPAAVTSIPRCPQLPSVFLILGTSALFQLGAAQPHSPGICPAQGKVQLCQGEPWIPKQVPPLQWTLGRRGPCCPLLVALHCSALCHSLSTADEESQALALL